MRKTTAERRPDGVDEAMSVTTSIAVHVFMDSVRDKVLYNLVGFAVLMISGSYLIGQLTAGQDVKIIKDLGLAAIAIFGLFIAVFIGIGLVAKEVDRHSIYTLLSKPVRRDQVILGKYAGLVLTLAVNLAVMAVALYCVLAYLSLTESEEFKGGWEAPAVDPAMLKAFFLIFVQLMLVTALALLFSTFSSQMLSAALTFGLYVVGHFSQDLRNFGEVVDSPAAAYVAKGLYYILPNLAPFNIAAEVVHAQPVALEYIAFTTAYGLTYIAVLLLVATFIFSRRDFT